MPYYAVDQPHPYAYLLLSTITYRHIYNYTNKYAYIPVRPPALSSTAEYVCRWKKRSPDSSLHAHRPDQSAHQPLKHAQASTVAWQFVPSFRPHSTLLAARRWTAVAEPVYGDAAATAYPRCGGSPASTFYLYRSTRIVQSGTDSRAKQKS